MQRRSGGYGMPGGGPMAEIIVGLSEYWVEDEPSPVVTFAKY
jgi:hypothetical protein